MFEGTFNNGVLFRGNEFLPATGGYWSEKGSLSFLRIDINPGRNNVIATQNRRGFFNPDVVASAISRSISFQVIESRNRFFDDGKRHDLTKDLAVGSVEHSGKAIRKVEQPTGRNGGLDGERVAAETFVVGHALHQSSVDENMSYPHDE